MILIVSFFIFFLELLFTFYFFFTFLFRTAFYSFTFYFNFLFRTAFYFLLFRITIFLFFYLCPIPCVYSNQQSPAFATIC